MIIAKKLFEHKTIENFEIYPLQVVVKFASFSILHTTVTVLIRNVWNSKQTYLKLMWTNFKWIKCIKQQDEVI